jgi:hypothetical protein
VVTNGLGKCTASTKILSHLGSWFIVWVTSPGLLDHEDEDTAILKDIGNYLLRLKNTIIDITLTYASETWLLTKRDRKQMNTF